MTSKASSRRPAAAAAADPRAAPGDVGGAALLAFLEKQKGIVKSILAAEEVDALEMPETGSTRARYTLSVVNGLDAEHGNFTDACRVTVIATSRIEAAKKARALEQRNWYYIHEIVEIDADASPHIHLATPEID